MAHADGTAPLSKTERAYAHLRDGILAGAYSPGERFVLNRIARDLAISPVPVREAIRLLEAEGLVSFQRNVGAVVAHPDETAWPDTIETLAVLEARAGAAAAPHLNRDILDRARAVNDDIREPALSAEVFIERDWQFHSTLTRPCPNPHLMSVLKRVRNLARISQRLYLPYGEDVRARTVADHDELLTALTRGADPRDIEDLVRGHWLSFLSASSG